LGIKKQTAFLAAGVAAAGGCQAPERSGVLERSGRSGGSEYGAVFVLRRTELHGAGLTMGASRSRFWLKEKQVESD